MYYAGIGSRNITEREERQINRVAKYLKKKECTLYSGNATGSDIAFQYGSQGNCVVFLPWEGFNKQYYDYEESLHYHVLQEDSEAYASIYRFHPNVNSLGPKAVKLMARNYYQIHGHGKYPPVDFVVCCAYQDTRGDVKGGTGFSVNIANSLSIPVINIRQPDWKNKLRHIANRF